MQTKALMRVSSRVSGVNVTRAEPTRKVKALQLSPLQRIYYLWALDA